MPDDEVEGANAVRNKRAGTRRNTSNQMAIIALARENGEREPSSKESMLRPRYIGIFLCREIGWTHKNLEATQQVQFFFLHFKLVWSIVKNDH
jgi:hypothetical protein